MLGVTRETLPLGTETLCSTHYWIYQPQIMLYASFKGAKKASNLAER
jgi:hypothetical protein